MSRLLIRRKPRVRFAIPAHTRSDRSAPEAAWADGADDGKYVVGPNENFSQSPSGSTAPRPISRRWPRRTGRNSPTKTALRVGDVIVAPEESELAGKYPDLCPSPERREVIRSRVSAVSTRGRYHSGPSYTVQQGDTLFDIAQFKLGSGSRWPEIYDLNSEVLQSDFNYLTPGMEIALPEASSDAVTERPASSGSRR